MPGDPLENIAELEAEYRNLHPKLERFAAELTRQLNELLDQQDVVLPVSIEHRVKTWDSLQEKLERKQRSISTVTELPDLVGLRIIVLFLSDLDKVCNIIEANFSVLERDDTQQRLQESQFGYSSIHYLIKLPDQWLRTPSMTGFGGLKAEVQVRTAAQHIWAAASHKLQYKQESNVPTPVRRAIYRVSALLETIDLELERVLAERVQYQGAITHSDVQEGLNTDVLARILNEVLPAENKEEVETYAEFLEDLGHFSITTQRQLEEILIRHKDTVLAEDAESVEAIRADITLQELLKADEERLQRGVFFTHVGLARAALAHEYGEEWAQYWGQKRDEEDQEIAT
jgi:GTP pyrophosphokinase